jgi:hypothetical protein
MPGYLVDEGGERTHAVLTLGEYERLTKAAEKLENVRGYALEMISAMSEEEAVESEDSSGDSAPENPAPEEHESAGGDQESRAWYQRT